MVVVKVRKFGDSLGAVLAKEVIDRLQTREGAALLLFKAPQDGYQLTPYDPTFEKKMTKADRIIMARKREGNEQETLDPGNKDYYEREFCTLRARLLEEGAITSLPASPTAQEALNDIVIRVRLASMSGNRPPAAVPAQAPAAPPTQR
jgi:hypothetical protein